MHTIHPAGVKPGLTILPRAYGLIGTLALVCLGAPTVSTLTASGVEAKTPGATYCFYKKCHRVKSLNETQALVGETVKLAASHYNDCRKDRYNPCGLTSSGEKFAPHRPDNAASPIYPDGTVLLVWNRATKDAAVVRINNAGPYWGDRKLDVSIATAESLGFRKRGVAKVATRIIQAPDRREATYVRNRRYRPVPGYIGKHDSIEKAERAAVAAMAVSAIATSTIAPPSGAVAMASQGETRAESADRLRKASSAEELRAATRAIEDLPVGSVSIAEEPSTTISDAWTPAAGQSVAEVDADRDVQSGAGRSAAVLERNVVPAALAEPAYIQTTEVADGSGFWRTLLFDFLKIDSSLRSWGIMSQLEEEPSAARSGQETG